MILLLVGITGAGSAFAYSKFGHKEASPVYAVVETVGKGTVSSGIEATGKIVAAQKLDLDVYKQTQRIDAVHMTNGGHVSAGDVLLSFDKSNASVEVESSQVKVAEAELNLSTERANRTDPNTTLRTLENDIVGLQTAIVQAEKDKVQALRDFFNANLSTEPGNTKTEDKTRLTISGLYNGEQRGEYRVTIYSSDAESGYSFSVSGLETGVGTVIKNIPVSLGTRGLKLQFPADIKNGDQWIIAVPNTYAPQYVVNKDAEEKKLASLEDSIASSKVNIANKEQQISDLKQTDSSSYRDLNVSKDEAALAEARVQLSKNYDVVKEQDIIAPFSGTIDGLANVVVGATPTGDSSDSISLGTLISDDFLVTFSLSATDVAKVQIGQKVLVSITSFPQAEPVEAFVTEVSSLPDSGDVAQYTVKAQIQLGENAGLSLREGLLANVEIVQKEVSDVLRIPLSAISYEGGKATVQMLGELTPEQQKQVDTLKVLSSDTGTFPSYPVAIRTGVTGSFYAEITEGLQEGAKILVSKTEQEVQVLQQRQFGPGAQGGGADRATRQTQSSGNTTGGARAE